MFETRLLERVCAGRSESRLMGDPSVLLDDILLHLRDMFNVRQGSVPIRPDYGMPDINDLIHIFPDTIEILRNEIRRQIVEFEPRLNEVSVRHIATPDKPLSLVFAVVATLNLAERRDRITVETEVGDNGFVRLAA